MITDSILLTLEANPGSTESIFSLTTVVSGVVGFLSGVIGGVLVNLAERYIEGWGSVPASSREWSIRYFRTEGEDLRTVSSKNEANTVHYAFTMRFFNRKRIDTGLRDVSIQFLRNGVARFTHTPYDPDKPIYPEGSSPRPGDPPIDYEKIDLLNLPSGSWVPQKCRGKLGAEYTQEVALCDQVVFVGYFPTGKEFREEIAKLG